MIKGMIPLLLLFIVAGCSHANVPAYGRLGDKDKTFLQGDWSNRTLTLRNINGLACSGDYSGMGPLTSDVFLTCSDGRTGNLILTRNTSDEGLFPDSKKKKKAPKNVAYGQGSLSDGTKFEVYLGQMSGLMKSPGLVK